MASVMMFAVLNLAIVGLLFAAMLAMQEVGRRLGLRDHVSGPKGETPGSGAAEGAVYALLGLLIAFTFSGAAGRYEARRQLVVDEANAIGTAWLRIDLLPTAEQPGLRDLFRQYVDARLESYGVSEGDARATARAIELQRRIWSTSVAAAKKAGEVPPYTVLLPALNDMIDITTTRAEARRMHPPVAVFVMLGVLALLGSLFAGYGMAPAPRSRVHTLGFAAVLAMALFVIVDFEFPRFGLIRVDAADSVLVDVRRSMD
jgi:hypothetical protein